MKIALVTPIAPSNEGVGRAVTGLAEALSKNHEVTIMSARGYKLVGITVQHSKVITLGNSGILFDLTFFFFTTLKLLWTRLKKKKEFDIIHVHCHGYCLFADVTTSHCCEKENVTQLHCLPKHWPRNSLFTRIKYRGWAYLEAWMSGPRRKKPLIVLSKRMKEHFIHHHGTPGENIFVIPDGVDCTDYNPGNVSLYREKIRCRHSLTEHELIVLLMGIDWVRKGVAQAIESLALLKEFPVQLVIVGPNNHKPYLRLAKIHGVEAQVIFTGSTREPWKYYATCDVFLLPSIYEPFGLVVLEAMATGLPVVVSGEAGAAELIQDGVNGLLLKDSRDAGEIATKLGILLDDIELRKQLGKNARRTAMRISWEQVAQRTLEVYRRVLV